MNIEETKVCIFTKWFCLCRGSPLWLPKWEGICKGYPYSLLQGCQLSLKSNFIQLSLLQKDLSKRR